MTKARSRVAAILQALAEQPHTLKQLCDRFDVDSDNLKTSLYNMVADGRVRVVGIGDNHHPGKQGRKPFLYGLPA